MSSEILFHKELVLRNRGFAFLRVASGGQFGGRCRVEASLPACLLSPPPPATPHLPGLPCKSTAEGAPSLEPALAPSALVTASLFPRPWQHPGEHGRQHHRALLERGHLHPQHGERAGRLQGHAHGDLSPAPGSSPQGLSPRGSRKPGPCRPPSPISQLLLHDRAGERAEAQSPVFGPPTGSCRGAAARAPRERALRLLDPYLLSTFLRSPGPRPARALQVTAGSRCHRPEPSPSIHSSRRA